MNCLERAMVEAKGGRSVYVYTNIHGEVFCAWLEGDQVVLIGDDVDDMRVPVTTGATTEVVLGTGICTVFAGKILSDYEWEWLRSTLNTLRSKLALGAAGG